MCRLMNLMVERRGYTPEFLRNIEDASHRVLKSTEQIIARLKYYHDNRGLIVIMPDFDMDGIAAGSEGFAGLSELGFNVALFMPNPNEGYGFTVSTIDRLKAEYPDVQAILTCDVGITCLEGVQRASELGIEVLVTDHHKEQERFPVRDVASATVNPMRLDEEYEHPAICGAYVLYQVLMSYAEAYGTIDNIEQIRRLVVFAGIGTVSDSMPVLYENRKVLRDAIDTCRIIYNDGDSVIVDTYLRGCDVYRRAFYGLYQTFCMFADMGKLGRGIYSIDEDFFGFYFAPMFNSVKRMGDDITHAFGVFFGANQYEEASYLFNLNEERKALVAEYTDAIASTIQPYAAQGIYITDAPSGIRGLLAQHIMNHMGFPTFVVGRDGNHFKGSGRSPEWYPAVDRATPMNFYLAGHNAAFGCGFTDEKELKAFSTFIKHDIENVINDLGELFEEYQTPVYDFIISSDGKEDIGIDMIAFYEFLVELYRYRPFGKDFPKPHILLRLNPNDEQDWNTMGSVNQHLKIRMEHGFTILCWNQANYIDLKDHEEPLYFDGYLEMSTWNDSQQINFIGNIISNPFERKEREQVG